MLASTNRERKGERRKLDNPSEQRRTPTAQAPSWHPVPKHGDRHHAAALRSASGQGSRRADRACRWSNSRKEGQRWRRSSTISGERADIAHFVPRTLASRPELPAAIWAIDEEHAPLYWLPRDCPRVAFWALPTSTPEDRARFLGQTAARIVIAIEAGAGSTGVRQATLFAYHLPGGSFSTTEGPGYHIARVAVTPRRVEPVGDLLARIAARGVELRLTPSLWPLYHALLPATLHYSMIRMRNAQPDRSPQGSGTGSINRSAPARAPGSSPTRSAEWASA